MSANVIEAGDISVFDPDTGRNTTVRCALLIEFDSEEAIRKAMHNSQ